MADEPEKKEDDPVAAIKVALTRALGSLKKLLGHEEEELAEEMEEVEGVSQGTSGQVHSSTEDASQKDDASE
jgi:predicted RecB family endonuclease